MTLNRNDLATMADTVAKAIHAKMAEGEEEVWSDLDKATQDQFRLVAYAAMGAHDAFLSVAGYSIVRPEKGPGKRLAAPPRQLLGPDGRPVN